MSILKIADIKGDEVEAMRLCDREELERVRAVGKRSTSDAGMIVYLLTGVDETNPDMVREILEDPV